MQKKTLTFKELLRRARAYNRSCLVGSDEKQDKLKVRKAVPTIPEEPSSVIAAYSEIITPQELAFRLKVPESWVFAKTRSRCPNPIPSLRIGRFIRFDWHAVVKWLELQAAA